MEEGRTQGSPLQVIVLLFTMPDTKVQYRAILKVLVNAVLNCMLEKRRDEMDENPMEPEITDRADVKTMEPENVLLTADGQKFLNQTRPWVRFMSIMVFIGAAVSLLAGLMSFLLEVTGGLVSARNQVFEGLSGGGFILGLIYFIMAIFYIPPGMFLSRYASAIRTLESEGTSSALESALKYQKSFWRYVGIFTVVCLIVTAAAITFSLAVGLFMFLNR
jgi:hypothetical protein